MTSRPAERFALLLRRLFGSIWFWLFLWRDSRLWLLLERERRTHMRHLFVDWCHVVGFWLCHQWHAILSVKSHIQVSQRLTPNDQMSVQGHHDLHCGTCRCAIEGHFTDNL